MNLHLSFPCSGSAVAARAQPDSKKPSQPAGSKSAAQVFQRYLDNPTKQPEEFRPRNSVLGPSGTPPLAIASQSKTSKQSVAAACSVSATPWSSAGAIGTCVTAGSSAASNAWTCDSLQPPAATSSLMSSSAPPGLSRHEPAVYSHASVERLVLDSVRGQSHQSASSGDWFASSGLPGAGSTAAASVNTRSSALAFSASTPTLDEIPSSQLPASGLDDQWSTMGDNVSDASNSPVWDSPGDPGSFDALAASAKLFQQQRADASRLPLPSSSGSRANATGTASYRGLPLAAGSDPWDIHISTGHSRQSREVRNTDLSSLFFFFLFSSSF